MLPIHFAPLQGFTEAPYRRIHQEVCGGITRYYTPFIRLEHGEIRRKDLREAMPEQNVGVAVIPQVIAADVEEFTQLAERLIAIGHHEIDINMGCPFPLQTRLGRGSGILPHPDRVERILAEAARLHDTQETTFSVKMRLGQESADEMDAILPLLNASPLAHITLHPRVGRAQYKGELDMERFDRFVNGSKNPVIYNGLIETAEQIAALEARYPQLAGVMIGRGLLARPTLAQEYAEGKALSDDAVRQRVMEMHRRLMAHYQQAIEGGDAQLLLKMQSFWEYMEPLFGHKAVKKICKCGSLRNYREAVQNALVR